MEFDTWFEPRHVAIVTGASQGFGRAVATELARAGLSLVIDARGTEALQAAERELAAVTGVVAIAGDVADRSHVHALVDAAQGRFGRIDLIVNNASTIGRSPLPWLEGLSPHILERIYATNLFAPLHLIRHALPIMRRTGGTIVNVTSDAAVAAYEGWGGYGSSKAALEGASRVLAAELAGSHINVLVADPGDMDTALHASAVPGADRAALADPKRIAPLLLAAIAAQRETFARVTLQDLGIGATA